MERKVKSHRGEWVNFDLFAIKQQMNEAPITSTIKQREKFIDMKKRRGGKKVLNSMVADMVATPPPVIEESQPEAVSDNETVAERTRRKIVKKDTE
jgi:hypothetical protein